MPIATMSDRYSAISSLSSASSSTSSSNCYNIPNSYSSSSHSSSLYLSKLTNSDYRSMQSLKIQQHYPRREISHTSITRKSPSMNKHILSSSISEKYHSKEETWLSCEELETIEKRFTDLLRNTCRKTSSDHQHCEQQRAKSCDRLAMNEENYKPTTTKISHQSNIDEIDNDYSKIPSTIVSKNDILKVESSYRSIGARVYASRSLCDLYITTTERLANLEDWILFQHGLPVWLLNSGTNPKRDICLSLIIAEYGSGFPIWQDRINRTSDVKQAREQHITFRLSDQSTLAALRFQDLSASKEFYSYYLSIRNDHRYKQIFSTCHNRSLSCGSILSNRKKSARHVNKSSISNPCQFQHITRLQIQDRARLTSLNQCLMPFQTCSNQLL